MANTLDREQTTPILPMDGDCNAVYQFIVQLSDNPGGTVVLSSTTNVSVGNVHLFCHYHTMLGDYPS